MKVLGHLKTVLIHKYFVGRYCFICGLYWQGIVHDLSKFSPTEFIESCRYYSGDRSPIDNCKDVNGYSYSWFHHRGRNYHHWEMWVDNFERGITRHKMPFKYVLEMVCDFLAAGRAYNGKGFTIDDEYEWWLKKREVALLNRHTLMFVDVMFAAMKYNGIEGILRDHEYIKGLKELYEHHPEGLTAESPFGYD